MLEKRLQALEIYESLPVPTNRDEAWRRTDIRRFKIDEFGPSINGDAAFNGADVPAYLGEQLTDDAAGGVLVQVNGVTKEYTLSDALKAQGVIFCDMSTAVREHRDLVRKHFMTESVLADRGQICRTAWRFLAWRCVPLRSQGRFGRGAVS